MTWRGRIINADITRYQSCVSNLHSMGVLDHIKKGSRRGAVLEIGGGYGGLAHGLGNRVTANATYVVLDLPEMLLFSGGYLIANNPDKKIYVYDPETFTPEFVREGIKQFDYALLPNYKVSELAALRDLKLVINMQSFQEMTPAQIREYLTFAAEQLDGFLYSDNVDCHPYNDELKGSSVSQELFEKFLILPPPVFYDGRPTAGQPWYYRAYLGVPRVPGRQFPPLPATAKMRVISGGEPMALEFGGMDLSTLSDNSSAERRR